jgi:hypothetical protein
LNSIFVLLVVAPHFIWIGKNRPLWQTQMDLVPRRLAQCGPVW